MKLEAGHNIETDIEAACANMRKETPTARSSFPAAPTMVEGDLAKLMRHADFARVNDHQQQFAIWIVTDNPAADGFVGIRSDLGLSLLQDRGGGDRPGREALAAIRGLFLKAEIDLAGYTALAAVVSPKEQAPLLPLRAWTDKKGRTLTASLWRVIKNEQGGHELPFVGDVERLALFDVTHRRCPGIRPCHHITRSAIVMKPLPAPEPKPNFKAGP
ncbi:MAG: hypothetical protein ACO1TE_00525 [Prosthecobacter sp.]